MADVLSLALPFFGLIFLGFGCGKLVEIGESGLRWLDFFILYLALPALFFYLVSHTPFEQIANWWFVLTTTLSTYICFALAFVIGLWFRRNNISEATIAGVVGAYANVGYMGPGLTLAALGPEATVPAALIFTFDSTLFFAAVPVLMALGGTERMPAPRMALLVAQRVFTHPFIIATILGVIAAWAHLRLPTALDRMLEFLKNAAAPCALFTLGVTVALRPMTQMPTEMPLILAVKLVLHPLLVWVMLSALGNFDPVWVYTALLMAALPPALNAFIMAKQYEVYIEQASNGILLGTIASVVTVTAMLYLLQRQLLPHDLFP